MHADHPDTVKALQLLFAQRPGWLLPDMHERLAQTMTADKFKKTALDAVLACYAYRFSQGAARRVPYGVQICTLSYEYSRFVRAFYWMADGTIQREL